MSYYSIDALQNTLGSTVFRHTKDSKKAAGRALGTLVEIIAYYLMRKWELTDNILIERPLPEYGNSSITHNVEFSFHPSLQVCTFNANRPITFSKMNQHIANSFSKRVITKHNTLLTSSEVIRNACILATDNNAIFMANIVDENCKVKISKLNSKPFAMVECKRVGVEEGSKKGPQTIEKAKQGAYVARVTSSLQKIRNEQGDIYGIIYKNNTPIIKDYSILLNEIVNEKDKLLKNFILSIGIVSNHGNWFTEENMNKELKVLAQSYDWLLFLSDKGLGQFINELLLTPKKEYEPVRKAFVESYKEGKKQNVFTKTKIDYKAHIALTKYFNRNINMIENWFNVITPEKKPITDLKSMLYVLKEKNWEEIL